MADNLHGSGAPFSVHPKRLALIARDWFVENDDDFHEECGLAPHVGRALRAADDAGCDAVLFSLWSRLHRGQPIRRAALYPEGTTYNTVIFADVDMGQKRWVEQVHVAGRGGARSATLSQRFGSVKDAVGRKRAFMAELPERSFGSTLVMLCGESNIIRTKRTTRKIVDEMSFLETAEYQRARLVLNPGHTYIRRPELRMKRARYSEGGRCCVALWNRGNDAGSEARVPWAVYFNGRDVTDAVHEVPEPVAGVHGIRLGVLDLGNLS